MQPNLLALHTVCHGNFKKIDICNTVVGLLDFFYILDAKETGHRIIDP